MIISIHCAASRRGCVDNRTDRGRGHDVPQRVDNDQRRIYSQLALSSTDSHEMISKKKNKKTFICLKKTVHNGNDHIE